MLRNILAWIHRKLAHYCDGYGCRCVENTSDSGYQEAYDVGYDEGYADAQDNVSEWIQPRER